MGYTRNEIIINGEYDLIFDKTNDIDNWYKLFSEYEKTEVIERDGNKILFKLTFFPEENGEVHSWTSERVLDKEHKRCIARRLEPNMPFKYMFIIWTYELVEKGVKMIWEQFFESDEKVMWDDSQFEDYLNKNTKEQMKIIKERVEME